MIIFSLSWGTRGQVVDSAQLFTGRHYNFDLQKSLLKPLKKPYEGAQLLFGRNYEQSRSIDLRINYYFKSYPIRDFYTHGKHFITIKEMMFPPYHYQEKGIVFFEKRK